MPVPGASVGKRGLENLYVRKIYGKEQLRLLCCRHCGMEFGERRGTPLWNCKLSEAKAMAIVEQRAEGSSFNARLVKVSPETVRRHSRKLAPDQVLHQPSWVLSCTWVVLTA